MYVRASVSTVRTYAHNRRSCVRSLDRSTRVRKREYVLFAIRPRVLRAMFSERARTRAVNLGALRQRTVYANDRVAYTLSPKEEEDRPDVFPVSTNPTRRRRYGARKGSPAEIYLTRISRERALP